MDWDSVRVVLAVYRGKTLQEAGKELGRDASTVSRQLATLERRLGARLFERTRDGLRPTAAAERLWPHAQGMAAEAAALVRSLAAAETDVTGTVRVATTEAFGAKLAADGLLDLRRAHPRLAIEILCGNRPVDLARGEAEIAVRVAELKQPALHAQCVSEMGIGLFAANTYVRARGPVRTVAGLRGHDVLLPTGDLARLPDVQWLAARPGIRVAFRSNSMPALVAAACAGHGILPLALDWGDHEAALARVLVLDKIPKRRVWLVMHETARSVPAVRVVAQQIAAIFARGLRH